MQYATARIGSKWHILSFEGDGLESVANGQFASAIAFDDRDAALSYIEVLKAEAEALAASPADPAPDTDSVFVGLDLADAPALVQLQDGLKSSIPGAVEWNTPDSFHITVVYALDVPAQTAAKLREMVKAAPVPDMQLKIGEPGVFNSGGGEGFAGPEGYALHYRVTEDAGLKAYQAALYEAFKAEGVTLSEYSNPADYKPHVTMGYAREDFPAVQSVDVPLTPHAVLYGFGDSTESVKALAADPAGEPEPDPAPAEETPETVKIIAGVDWGQPDGDRTAVTVQSAGDPLPVFEAVSRPAETGPAFMDRIKRTLKALGIIRSTPAEIAQARIAEAFKALAVDGTRGVIKGLGDGLFIAAFTNNFVDRDGEIISTVALDGMIERMNAGLVPFPDLWYKHKWYTKHGETFFVSRAGHIVYAVGRFDKTLLGAMMEKFYKANPGLAMSHGFTFPPWGFDEASKVYTVINTFEISVLPPQMAANLYTPFKTVGEESKMQLTAEQVKELESELGPQIAAVIVQNHKALEGAGDKIEKILGPAFKDFTAALPGTAPATPVQTATDTGTAAPADTPAADTEAEDKAPDMAAVGQLLSDLMDSVIASNEAIMFLAERNNEQQAFNTAVAEALGVAPVAASEDPATAVAPDAEAVAEAGKNLAAKAPGKNNPYAEIPALAGMFPDGE